MFFLHYLLTADQPSSISIPFHITQSQSMVYVVGPTAAKTMFPIMGDPERVCDWRGVTCDSRDIVRNIVWRRDGNPLIRMQFLQIEWLPSTLQEIIIESQFEAGSHALETRYLPREAIDISIRSSVLKGTVDMSALPSHLVKLNLSHNSLSGTVHLIGLPNSLVVVNLEDNPISMVVVDSDSLPESFQKAMFRTDNIRKIDLHHKKMDKRVHVRSYEDLH